MRSEDPTENLSVQDDASGDAAESWTLVVHDGNGTWHAVSTLHLVAVTADELEQLEDGDEDVLDGLPSVSVRQVLEEHADIAPGMTWT